MRRGGIIQIQLQDWVRLMDSNVTCSQGGGQGASAPLAILQYTRRHEWHNSTFMQPDDETTTPDDRSAPFGTAPRPRSVFDVISERYDIVKELGAGGMGVVLHVFDRLTEEDVALKLIRPELAQRRELVDRFKREVRLARQITHKRVCRTYELLRFADTFAISMEYVDGDSLRELLRRLGGLGSRTVTRIAEEICSALEEAHLHGIVHRDLKPENVMLDREGHVKVMDFGIAHSPAFADTAPGAVIGTPSYMAPEQASGGGQIDARTDIYLFGLLLYEMYAGSAVGQDLQPGRIAELLQQHRDVIPETVAQVITRCLERAPSARYQSASEVAVALQLEPVSSKANTASPPLGLRLFAVATAVEEELAGLNANLEGPCTRTETWQRLPEFLEKRRVITASTARSLELFRSILSFSTKWKDWSESEMAKTVELGEALIAILRAIPAPEFTVEEVNIVLFQDESCITPLPQPVGVRVNIRYSDGSDALRMYPAGRKFRIGEQVRPWWETRRPYTRIYYRDSSGKPALAWDFAFPFVGFVLGAAATQGQ
jgi:serine/threonine protein kinase